VKLKRTLGFWDVFCIASGAMISSGLFVLPGMAFSQGGPAIVLAYALAGFLVIPAALSQAELVSAMPRSGGSYFFVERSMGALPGTLAGLAEWFSISLKSAFALIGIGAFAQLLKPDIDVWTIKSIAVGCCLLFAAINIFSVKTVGHFQVVMVAFLLALLCGFITLGLPHVRHESFANFMQKGPLSLIETMGMVFISFGGLTTVAAVSGEVRNPGRNLPAGMLSALVLVSLIYVTTVFITVGILKPEELYNSATNFTNYTPICTAAGKFLGTTGVIALAAAAMLAFITTGNSGILTASRSPMAMSHDGLLPHWFRKLSSRRTPYISILLTTAFMILLISVLTVKDLVKVASTMMIVLFLMSNLAVIVMRGSKIQNYRPLFKSPAFPWIQMAGILVYLALIIEMGWAPLATTAIFFLLGALWYMFYVRPRTSRESAFIYLVRNILSRKMYRSDLEDELREIALERDEIIQDRFDHLIQDCAILDLPEKTDAETLFGKASEIFSQRLGLDAEQLLTLFHERECESSTVIQPGLAIPHIVVEGQNKFDILLVRCKDGIDFAEAEEPVCAAFVLAGSPDERNYHLRALMTIAHIVQEEGLIERWIAAHSEENLRDIILLSERQRNA
jgi:amino acid transporter/mannitol/fructose-specific phosphotransferase system IIA component (Ntr-type)